MSLITKFLTRITKQTSIYKNTIRNMCMTPGCGDDRKKGLILGVYSPAGKLTPTAQKFDQKINGRLKHLLNLIPPPPKKEECRIFFDLDPEFAAIAVVGIGEECQGYDSFEQIDEGKEAIRIAASTGIRSLRNLKLHKVAIEGFGHAESAAEGAALGVWLNQEHKEKHHHRRVPVIELYEDCDFTGWQIGLQKANAQNFARQLTDTPSNCMTPSGFAQNSVEILCKCGINVEVKVQAWAETQGMEAFLAASKGSCEPPIFLELSYYGTTRAERPVVIIGKGVTYNSGGLCLKNTKEQTYMRGDMAGAAITVATCAAIAGLQLPINIRGLIPLCENMPGCNAMKPGDIVRVMNGKFVKIETTDCAGRLILADTLVYAQSFWPRFILDIGTMGMDLVSTLGASGSAVFTNSEALWEYLMASAMHTGDRVWRFPLWNHFSTILKNDEACDVKSHGIYPIQGVAGACSAAAFLNEFLPCGDWVHLDCQNVLVSTGRESPYLRPGMSGRPTRTLVEFFSQIVCHKD